ncbi:craniofacial development protein 2 [Biomphalaria glabrata]|nr:craniofacial development protein 2 [Biomphalaria glabrata]
MNILGVFSLTVLTLEDQGQLTEVGASYTFFWISKNSEERREAGVDFAVKSKLVNKLARLPKKEKMTVKRSYAYPKTSRAYAPTMSNQYNIKENF